jgi:hypothetical protein
MAGRRCVFCGGQNLTREHAWPKWLSRLAEEAGVEVRGAARRFGKWERPAVDLKVRRVCEDCNHGWMASLEEQIKPLVAAMFFGQPQLLLEEEQQLLSFWGCKTAFMLSLAGSGHPVDANDLVRIYKTRAPVGVVMTAFYSGTYGLWHQQSEVSFRMDNESMVGYALTMSMGNLVLQVTNRPEIEKVLKGVSSEARAYLMRLWPIRNPVRRWPPMELLDDRLMRSLAFGFKNELRSAQQRMLGGPAPSGDEG